MKNNGKFITLTVSLLLASAALLTGCMEMLAASSPKEKNFDPGDVVDVSSLLQTGRPPAQSELQVKYEEYGKVETDADGRRMLTLFPDGQAEELLAKRENGEESRLSYEEILFLINDSIQLYNKYDVIILPEARRLGLVLDEFSMSDYVIDIRHVDASELSYNAYYQMTQQAREDIYTIILYRLYLLDTGLRRYYESALALSSHYSGIISYTPFEQDPVTNIGYALVLGEVGGSFPGITFPDREDSSPDFLLSCLDVSRNVPYAYFMDAEFSLPKDTLLLDFTGGRITLTTAETQTQLYPTDDTLPEWELNEHYFDTDTITIDLCYYPYGTYYKGPTLTDADVKLLLEALDPKSVVAAQNDLSSVYNESYFYYYIVDFHNGTWILIPYGNLFSSQAIFSGTAAVTGESEYTGQTFKLCVPEKFDRLVMEYFPYGPYFPPYDPD